MTIKAIIIPLTVFVLGGQIYILYQYLNDCYKAMGR